MSSCITLLCALLLLLGLSVEASSGGGGTTSFSYDLSGPALLALLNSPVHLAERMKRPLDGFSWQRGCLSHSGVRVTLADGSQWLVHKGDKFGISSQTVVVDARHMSDAWEVFEKKDFNGEDTVSDFVEAGGTDYTLVFNNCHAASLNMMEKESKRSWWCTRLACC
ncbi:hypothetical protein OYC64_001065 [Pagothenia borchgrevinki]|uniref:Uncharacterized protein n=1 Tax=Pagothenia borchgrevinki TaxID=8213 RepID=A0ABD2HG48_PAGBO